MEMFLENQIGTQICKIKKIKMVHFVPFLDDLGFRREVDLFWPI